MSLTTFTTKRETSKKDRRRLGTNARQEDRVRSLGVISNRPCGVSRSLIYSTRAIVTQVRIRAKSKDSLILRSNMELLDRIVVVVVATLLSVDR